MPQDGTSTAFIIPGHSCPPIIAFKRTADISKLCSCYSSCRGNYTPNFTPLFSSRNMGFSWHEVDAVGEQRQLGPCPSFFIATSFLSSRRPLIAFKSNSSHRLHWSPPVVPLARVAARKGNRAALSASPQEIVESYNVPIERFDDKKESHRRK